MLTEQRDRLNAALAGRYAIERALGSGGMATVYLADDLKHHRKVAVKVLRPELASVLGADRFLREVAIAAQLNHPHILALYDSGAAAGSLFYVMPYIKGESLRQKLEREKQLPIEEALRITRETASALHYAHSQNVIHRDIKPENILLYEGEAMVADFGIALAVAAAPDRLTESGLIVGTPEYMSPEQGTGERALDARSDVYSLACVLYEMLTGEPPFSGRTVQALIAKRLVDPVPAVRRLRTTVPVAVEQALTHALARIPADRLTTVRAFAEALTQAADARPAPASVAVLPFVNLSANPENEYFADGMTEDVIAQLSKIHALKVISRTSVMQFKNRKESLREIGAKLEAGALLEGSVRRVGDQVRIVAQLIDAETDRHLWAETYDRRLTDVFAIQSEVALHIAAALQAELSRDEQTRIRRPPTTDVEAYQLYLQGRQCYTRYTEEGMRQGIQYFERAIQKDPQYALAYTGLALALMELVESGEQAPGETYGRAQHAVAKALELDSGLGEAHFVLANLKLLNEYDWNGAEREFKRALELSPNSADIYDHYGRMLESVERFDEAIAMLQRARELDPLAHRLDLASALLGAGRHDEALAVALAALAIDPSYARARATLGWVYLKSGRSAEGVEELEKAVELAPNATIWLAELGQAYALAGRVDKARAVLKRLDERSRLSYVAPYHVAYVYAGLGEQDAAMDWLERAFEERSGAVYGIKGSFLFTMLRANPRFTALLKKMNLA